MLAMINRSLTKWTAFVWNCCGFYSIQTHPHCVSSSPVLKVAHFVPHWLTPTLHLHLSLASPQQQTNRPTAVICAAGPQARVVSPYKTSSQRRFIEALSLDSRWSCVSPAGFYYPPGSTWLHIVTFCSSKSTASSNLGIKSVHVQVSALLLVLWLNSRIII
jgi:hypothetical protein